MPSAPVTEHLAAHRPCSCPDCMLALWRRDRGAALAVAARRRSEEAGAEKRAL